MTGGTAPEEQPFLEVVSGDPTDEETAAVAALLEQLLLEQAASFLPLPADGGQPRWIPAGGAIRRPLDRSRGWQAF